MPRPPDQPAKPGEHSKLKGKPGSSGLPQGSPPDESATEILPTAEDIDALDTANRLFREATEES
jgi:hypothetical protein